MVCQEQSALRMPLCEQHQFVDRAAGFPEIADGRPIWEDCAVQRTTTGTHDILLYRDVFAAFLYAAFDDGKLLDDPALVRDRLRATISPSGRAPAPAPGKGSPGSSSRRSPGS